MMIAMSSPMRPREAGHKGRTAPRSSGRGVRVFGAIVTAAPRTVPSEGRWPATSGGGSNDPFTA